MPNIKSVQVVLEDGTVLSCEGPQVESVTVEHRAATDWVVTGRSVRMTIVFVASYRERNEPIDSHQDALPQSSEVQDE